MNRKKIFRAVVLPAALLWSFSTPSFSQRTGGNTGGNPGGVVSPGTPSVGTPTNPGINTPGRNTIPNTNNPTTNFPSPMDRPIYLSGKVVLDDGTPPPDSVTIEKVCNGSPRPTAYTDSKGRFQFELNHPTGVMPDASVSSMNDSIYGSNSGSGSGFPRQSTPQSMGGGRNLSGEVSLQGCELRAALPGFRSDSVNLAMRRSMDNPDVGTIVLHRLGNVDGTTISMTSLLAPKDAHKALDKGRDALKKNKPEDAEKELRKAVEAYPKYAVAWFELGRLQARNLKPEDALQSFHQAIAADPKFVSPYIEMAQIYVTSRQWQDAVTVTDQTIRLNPGDFPHIYLFNALANYNLKQVDQAEKSAREGQKVDAQHRVPKLEELLAMILSDKGDFDAAAEHLRNYLRISPNAADADKARGQLLQIEKLAAARKETAPPPQ